MLEPPAIGTVPLSRIDKFTGRSLTTTQLGYAQLHAGRVHALRGRRQQTILTYAHMF